MGRRSSFHGRRSEMLGNGFGHSGDALENFASALRGGDLEPVFLVERHDQLEGIHRVKAEAASTEEGLLVANLFGGDLQHEVLHHQLLDFPLECPVAIHHNYTTIYYWDGA